MRAADKSRGRTRPAPQERTPNAPSLLARWSAPLERYHVAIAILLVVIASARIVGTYWEFSHTSDEPAHLACGMEWLDRGVYRYEAQHPPLARVAAAIGPYLLGARSHGIAGAMYTEGLRIYLDGGGYDQMVAASRAGILPFFWLACFVVFAWAKRDFGAPAAILALFFFSFLPPVLAHAGLATTDMALTAFLGAAFLAARLWVAQPGVRTAIWFGICGALAVLSKFSSLAFFPAAAILGLAVYLASGRLPARELPTAVKQRLPSFAIAVAVACTVVWAGYRFSFGKVGSTSSMALPAPELFRGVATVLKHNAEGHLSYLLGKVGRGGFWDYYFVVLGVKTPIPFLLLAAAGVGFAFRSARMRFELWLPVAFSAGVLLVGLFSRINIGVRHILPIYIGLSIVAAVAVLELLERGAARKWAPAAVAVLLGWFALTSVRSHPDYLPYFNEFAGSHPENILVDSDLDWGQDIKRLERRLQQGGARALAFTPMYWLNEKHGLPLLRPTSPQTPLMGWNAVELSWWKQYRFGLQDQPSDVKFWPDRIPPQEIVGKSIYLWYFPPSSGLPLEAR